VRKHRNNERVAVTVNTNVSVVESISLGNIGRCIFYGCLIESRCVLRTYAAWIPTMLMVDKGNPIPTIQLADAALFSVTIGASTGASLTYSNLELPFGLVLDERDEIC